MLPDASNVKENSEYVETFDLMHRPLVQVFLIHLSCLKIEDGDCDF